MLGKSLFSALIAAAIPASALGLCADTTGTDVCVPVLACIGDEGDWFQGRALGSDAGVLGGVLANGAICTGTWTARNEQGLGQADAVCGDGETVRVIYTYQDPATGTAIGEGVTSSGRKVLAYSGNHVRAYVQDHLGAPANSFLCGTKAIPIS